MSSLCSKWVAVTVACPIIKYDTTGGGSGSNSHSNNNSNNNKSNNCGMHSQSVRLQRSRVLMLAKIYTVQSSRLGRPAIFQAPLEGSVGGAATADGGSLPCSMRIMLLLLLLFHFGLLFSVFCFIFAMFIVVAVTQLLIVPLAVAAAAVGCWWFSVWFM